MLVLLVLLSCLVSILVITLLQVQNINRQVIVFEVIIIAVLLFKLLFDFLVNKNKLNPKTESVEKNNNITNNFNNNSNNQIKPVNFNSLLNNASRLTPNEVLLNNQLNNNEVNLLNNNEVNLLNNNEVNLLNNALVNTNNGNGNSNNLSEVNLLNNNEVNLLNNALVNTNNGNGNSNNLSEVNQVNTKSGCLLDGECACKNITQDEFCCNHNSDSHNGCSSCPVADKLNGKNVPENCLKNNTINYSDMLNVDRGVYPNVRDCATDTSCVIDADNHNLHFDSPYSDEVAKPPSNNIQPSHLNSVTVMPSVEEAYNHTPQSEGPHPGDADFTEVKDFWKMKKNNSDLCYIKRVLPKYFCEQ